MCDECRLVAILGRDWHFAEARVKVESRRRRKNVTRGDLGGDLGMVRALVEFAIVHAHAPLNIPVDFFS